MARTGCLRGEDSVNADHPEYAAEYLRATEDQDGVVAARIDDKPHSYRYIYYTYYRVIYYIYML